MLRMINKEKLMSYRTTPRYKFRYELPRKNDYEHDLELNKVNGNECWRDVVALGVEQQHGYDIYEDLGLNGDAPNNFKNIRVHFVFDFNHDGCNKARLIAGGHLIDVSLSSVYSGVFYLKGIILILFLSELNGLE